MPIKVIRIHRHQAVSVISGLVFLWGVLSIAQGQYVWIRPLLVLLLANGTIRLVARPMFRRLDAAVSPWTILGPTLSCLLAAAKHASGTCPRKHNYVS